MALNTTADLGPIASTATRREIIDWEAKKLAEVRLFLVAARDTAKQAANAGDKHRRGEETTPEHLLWLTISEAYWLSTNIAVELEAKLKEEPSE